MMRTGSSYWSKVKNYGAFIGLVGLIVAFSGHAQDTLSDIRFTVKQYEVIGDNPIGADAYKALEPYLGEQYGLEGLSAAADELERAVIKAGYSFHRVSLPPQELLSGTVKLKLSKFTMGKVVIEGNKHFDDENIRNSVPELKPGETPNTLKLSQAIKLANQHASKKVSLKFTQGEESDTIDAILTVRDQKSHVFFVTLDNTGTEQTEELRTTLGYQHGNLFNRDHALTATLTTAPQDPASTTQIGLNYQIPLYDKGTSLSILFSDSEINSGTVGEGISVSGKGSVLGFIYNNPIPTTGSFTHQWTAGVQYKLFENTISFGASDEQTDVLSLPVEVGYGFQNQNRGRSFSGGVRYAINIPGSGDGADDNYETSRPGAKNDWSVLRFNLGYDQLISEDWLFHLGLSGQNSSDLLISGEQFGVGGVSSLRGFEERSVTGDSGNQLNFELRFPPVTQYNLRFAALYDLASVEFNDGDSTDISSFGVGFRWSWKQNLNVSLDYGHILDGGGPDSSINQDGDDKLHMNLVYRF
jgi:hemolysin activation/secretion protein